MAWWQKKLLHYALSRTGLLDDNAIDPKNLDITLGRQNVVDLKDVGLNIQRITKLAQLPPSLRLETARVLSLRLTVPADIYQSSITAEIDGVELSLRIAEHVQEDGQKGKRRASSPVTTRTPQHRKAHRRLYSPPPYDPGGRSDSGDNARIPTTHQVAKSFLLEEPVQERIELEASVVANSKRLEESMISESSEGDEVGTGDAIGLPGFLAGFLQGIVDRLQIRLKNVEVKLETEVPGDSVEAIPLTLRLRVGHADLASLTELGEAGVHAGKRHVELHKIALDVLSDATVFSELSELPSRASPATSRATTNVSPLSAAVPSSVSDKRSTIASTYKSFGSGDGKKDDAQHWDSKGLMQASIATADGDYFADATTEHGVPAMPSQQDLEIKAGDDNISWGSRRSKSIAPSEDLWNSMASEDDLPESLLLERDAIPRLHSARGDSPVANRTRRAVSPYDRSLQSPGSWPTFEESPDRRRLQQSPGSWPLMDQSQYSLYQPLTTLDATEAQNLTIDNKGSALEGSTVPLDAIETLPEAPEGQLEDLTQSRVFSHEDAESMYMSAMTQSPRMEIPGGWSSEASRTDSPPSLEAPGPVRDNPTAAEKTGTARSHHATGDLRETSSGNVTPRAQSPDLCRARRDSQANDRPLVAKQIVLVDTISVWIPNSQRRPPADSEINAQKSAGSRQDPSGMPGTFSAYSDPTISRSRMVTTSTEDNQSVVWAPAHRLEDEESRETLEIVFGFARVFLDLASCRLLYKTMLLAKSTLKPPPSSKIQHQQASGSLETTAPSQTPVSLLLHQLQLSLSDKFNSTHVSDPTPQNALIALDIGNAALKVVASEVNVRLGNVKVLLGDGKLVAFDRHGTLTNSTIITDMTPDVALHYSANRSTIQKRPITELTIETLPVNIDIDLGSITETFGSFGGLSGVLELSNSILSDGQGVQSPTSTAKPTKGVRFQGDPVYIDTSPETKVNGRVGGAAVTLRGEACSVYLRATTIKAVYRESGAVVVVEQVSISGPKRPSDQVAPIFVDLASIRSEYFVSPSDKDLERLLSLLTPSKDKYDSDDDILLDTLLKQRRKGAVAKASVAEVKVKVADFDCIATLTALGQEMGKLSAVTKYLPEDERPGLLSLVRIKDFEAQLPVNGRFGTVQLVSEEFHLAHVGLPALVAFAIGTISASQASTGEPVLHQLMQSAGADNLPMIMARMLGDEVEPTAKVKLFNVCVEYSVPIILDLTGMDLEKNAEEMVAEMTRSVAALALPRQDSAGVESTPSGSSTKRTNLDLLVHDCAIGLKPQNLASKLLLVITDARISTLLPPEDTLVASLDLKKATVFVTDSADSRGAELAVSRRAISNTTTNLRLAAILSKQGYASVASIMSAHMSAKVQSSADRRSQSVDVDVKNELLLLETCADSTATLIATISALSPPIPPSKQQKYLTEPMTIEDMMASIFGDPFTEPGVAPETLFDVAEEPSDGLDLPLDSPTFGNEANDLLIESEMTSSLYDPVSGMLEGVDSPVDDESGKDDRPETAESLLEEDPFEMPTSPTDMRLSDSALMRDLIKQCKPASSDETVDLDLYEIEDLGFDALSGSDQQALGSQLRFNTPTATRRQLPTKTKGQTLPFRLRLRDIHVIWNIYDGYDWERTRDGITQAVEQVEIRAEERKARRRQSLNDREEDESVIGDLLFNSIYIGVPANHDAQDLRREINRHIDDLASETESVPLSGMSRPTTYSASGRPVRPRQRRRLKLERSKTHKIAFELKGVSADLLVFPSESKEVLSSIDVRIRDFEIFDNVPTSTWRKFLTHLNNDAGSREMSKPMMHIELLSVRTLQDFAASEIVVHVAVSPLRLHVDQDALDFISRFFEFKDESMIGSGGGGEQPFLQRVEVDTVDLKLDYKPKHIDYVGLRSGHTTEFMNFITLDAANIRLRHAIVYGIRGFEPLHKTLNDVWMPDIKRNQLPTVLAGLAPVRSLVNIGSGIRDVVAIPVQEYRKDGRIIRSIQKGAFHFGKTTASELARLGAKVAMGTQNILSGAEELLSPSSGSPSGRPNVGRRVSSEQGWHDVGSEEDEPEQRAISAYANQPLGVLSGLRSARRYLEHDLLTAKDALFAVQGEFLESGSTGAAAAAVKHAPTVILRPVIGASRAVGTALLGFSNQIDSENLRKVEDKYKRR